MTQTQLAEAAGLDSQSAIARIESGRRATTPETLLAIASALGCRPGALWDEAEGAAAGELRAAPLRRVPLLDWDQVTTPDGVLDAYQSGRAMRWVPTEVAGLSPHAYALTVRGDSMAATSGPTFRDGTIIVVDPRRDPSHGSFVIVRSGAGARFGRLAIEPPDAYLAPLNPVYPVRPITPDMQVIGVAVAKAEVPLL